MELNRFIGALALFCSLLATQSSAVANSFDFSVDTDDGVVASESLTGQVVYVDFWASWCVPCRKSFPWMNDMQDKYRDQGFKIVAINLDKEKSLALQFLDKLPANFTIGYDPAGQLAEEFGVIGMPMAFLINRQGKLIHKHVGFQTSKIPDYEQAIVEILEHTE